MPATAVRNHHTPTANTIVEFLTLSFTGTYVTGGVPFNPSTIPGATPGTSPIGGTVLTFDAYSPLGYTYRLIGSGASGKVKILNGITELANAAAFPDASVTAVMEVRKGQ